MVNRKINRLMESNLSAEDIVARLLEQKNKEVVAERHSTSDDVDEENEEQED